MTQWHWLKRSLLVLLVCLLTCASARASEYYGKITFGGLPLPGATIIATQGDKTFGATSDEGGIFHFADLPDGQWTIEVKMQCFKTIHTDVAVTPNMPASNWELKLLPTDQLQALATAPPLHLPSAPQPMLKPSAEKKQEAASAPQTPEMPKPPAGTNEQSPDGLLVN